MIFNKSISPAYTTGLRKQTQNSRESAQKCYGSKHRLSAIAQWVEIYSVADDNVVGLLVVVEDNALSLQTLNCRLIENKLNYNGNMFKSTSSLSNSVKETVWFHVNKTNKRQCTFIKELFLSPSLSF